MTGALSKATTLPAINERFSETIRDRRAMLASELRGKVGWNRWVDLRARREWTWCGFRRKAAMQR